MRAWFSTWMAPSAVNSFLMRKFSSLSRVAPPRPKLVPRPGTVAECQMRAWFSIWIAPIAVNSFLIR